MRIDGKEETKLVHSVCTLSDRHRWMTLNGYDVVGHTVEWTGDRLNVRDL